MFDEHLDILRPPGDEEGWMGVTKVCGEREMKGVRKAGVEA